MSGTPKDRRYAKSHEWAQKAGDLVVVGITEFAVHELSDLVFIELPEAGAAIAAGDSFGSIESVKAVSELISPVTGKIAEVNEDLENALETIVDSPWEDGWIVKIELTDPAEYDGLMSSEDYDAQLSAGE